MNQSDEAKFHGFLEQKDFTSAVIMITKVELNRDFINQVILKHYKKLIDDDDGESAEKLLQLFQEYVTDSEIQPIKSPEIDTQAELNILSSSAEKSCQTQALVALGRSGDAKAVDPILEFLKNRIQVSPPPQPDILSQASFFAGLYVFGITVIISFSLLFFGLGILIWPLKPFILSKVAKTIFLKKHGIVTKNFLGWSIFWRKTIFDVLMIVLVFQIPPNIPAGLYIIFLIVSTFMVQIPFYGWCVYQVLKRPKVTWTDADLASACVRALGKLGDKKSIDPIEKVAKYFGEGHIQTETEKALRRIRNVGEFSKST